MTMPQEKILAWDNQFHEEITQTVVGSDCITIPLPQIDPDVNAITLNLTAIELREMLSSIQIGAEWAYPDKSQQILFNFMRGLICPPELDPNAACTRYSATSAFVQYSPNHPDSQIVPAGYISPAWVRFGTFDSIFPDWIDQWLQGIINDFTGYVPSDVLCNIGSFPANTVEAFLSNGGIFPSFEIHVTGTGTIEIEFLSFPLGGRACIKLDSPPNIIDLLTGGILDSATLYVDTNRDLFSFPPEENVASTIKVDIDTVGNHILYVVFVPVIDDTLLFIGLGGGVRSIELCGFEEIANVGIESVIWDNCELKTVSGGVETLVATAAQIQACLDFSGIGAGGGGGIAAYYDGSYRLTAQIATNSNVFIDADAANISELIYLDNPSTVVAAFYVPQFTKGTSGLGSLQLAAPVLSGGMVIDAVGGSALVQGVWVLGQWDLPAGENEIRLQIKSNTGANAVLANQMTISWQVWVFTDQDLAFVQDIRIEAGELQKKINGVWLNVVDSLAAIVSSLQSQVTAAASTANTALTTANGAVAVNNTQHTRLVSLESHDAIIWPQVPVWNTTLADHDARLDALESAPSTANRWGGYPLGAVTDLSLTPSLGRYSSAINSYSNGGWQSNVNKQIIVSALNAGRYGSVAYIRLTAEIISGTGHLQARANGGNWAQFDDNIYANNFTTFVEVQDSNANDIVIELQGDGTLVFALVAAVWLYINFNPFTGELAP